MGGGDGEGGEGFGEGMGEGADSVGAGVGTGACWSPSTDSPDGQEPGCVHTLMPSEELSPQTRFARNSC